MPILRAHSLSIKAIFEKSPTQSEAIKILTKTKGLKIFKSNTKARYATPYDATFKKHILCSKIIAHKNNMLNLWVVGDQLLKGAALNALQIFELFTKNYFHS